MHLDSNFSYVELPRVENSIFTGTKYCFCHFSNTYSTSWDGRGENFDWKAPISVLWDAEQLAAFRPSDTVHSYKLQLMQDMEMELVELKKKVKKAKESWEHSSERRGNVKTNPKQEMLDRIDFLETFTVVFVKINYV